MTHKIFYVIFLAIIILTGCGRDHSPENMNRDIKYVAYYFHPTARCESCINIENFTKELIEKKYSKNPEIKFFALNIEDTQNEHFRKDYDLKFSSVVISKTKDNKEEKYKNLDSIWTYSSDKEGFNRYVISEIKEFIK